MTGATRSGPLVRAVAPGRVNLIGDHTDYTGGYVLPMALDMATTVEGRRGGGLVHLVSAGEEAAALVPLSPTGAPVKDPPWARFVSGVVSALRPTEGLTGTVTTTLPVGAGLSSSSSLTVALCLALGAPGEPRQLALTAQRAEQAGSGVPGGIMDQLCASAAIAGHALLIDCRDLHVDPVALPEEAEVVVAHSGLSRRLSESAYAVRRGQCEAAEDLVGPLRDASEADVATIADPVLRRRARHVVSENRRVLDAAAAMRRGDLDAAGTLMTDSHRSLRDDFDVSVPELDRAVDALLAVPGVTGARLTGAGFGGCVVALAHRGTMAAHGADLGLRWWVVTPAGGATVEVLDRLD
ncbi:MAG TPA: galactokinase [Acidimicrobiales bacterium]|nr:galactokinase [Acidimicrobiales bacterium]